VVTVYFVVTQLALCFFRRIGKEKEEHFLKAGSEKTVEIHLPYPLPHLYSH
jgi:hypothetical protein